MRTWIWAVVGLVACGSKEADSAGGSTSAASSPYLNILSPTPGEFIDEGEAVLLEAEGRSGSGALSAVDAVTWTLDDGTFSVDGNALTVTDLPAGVFVLTAEGTVDGVVVSDFVDVVVYAQ